MGQLDPVQVDAGLPQVVSVFANSIDGFSKRDQERTPVSDLAERDELFDVELERLALSPVNLYPERLDSMTASFDPSGREHRPGDQVSHCRGFLHGRWGARVCQSRLRVSTASDRAMLVRRHW